MSGHVLDVVVVLYEGVCVYSILVSLLESFQKLSRIFLVKEGVDAIKPALFLSVFPKTLESFSLWEVF